MAQPSTFWDLDSLLEHMGLRLEVRFAQTKTLDHGEHVLGATTVTSGRYVDPCPSHEHLAIYMAAGGQHTDVPSVSCGNIRLHRIRRVITIKPTELQRALRIRER